VCAYCGRVAPGSDDPTILQWEGGEALYQSEHPDLPPESLVCPDCRLDERERDEGAGD
jgi:hypothetical protein